MSRLCLKGRMDSNTTNADGYASAFEVYYQLGWSVIPLKHGTKWPPPKGWTGEDGAIPSYPDMHAWAQKRPKSNIAIRLPRNVIGIDVDHYGAKKGGDTFAEAQRRWGSTKPTYRSTSRTDGVSGIRLYRVPEGVKLAESIEFDELGLGGIEVVQFHHRYVMCWPSVHDKSGDTYRWIAEIDDTVMDGPPALDDLPELPGAWVEALTEPERNSVELPPDFVLGASDLFTEGEQSPRVALKLGRAIENLYAANSRSRHIVTRDRVLGLLRLGKNGEPGVRSALNALCDVFVNRVAKERTGGRREARAEFKRFVYGSDKDAKAKRIGPKILKLLADDSYDDDDEDDEADAISSDTTLGESFDSPEPADESDEDDAREAKVTRRVEALQLDAEARRRLKAIDAQQLCANASAPIPLAEFLAVPDTEAQYRISELWPTGGRVLLTAQKKAGKTTMVDNVVRSLADGRPFLNQFATAPARIALIDAEMDENQMRRWLRAQSITNQGNVAVLPLRGSVSAFNIMNPDVMATWAGWLRGYDVIILDCLRPVLDALGLDEDHDAGTFLVAFDALLKSCGASEAIVVHHMGHNGERGRGSSRIEDWPDAIWRIVRDKDADDPDDPAGDRYFKAFGRDVNVPEGKLDYTHETRELSYLGVSRKAGKALHLVPAVVDLVRAKPGLTKNHIEKAEDLSASRRQEIRDALATAIASGYVFAEKAEDSSHAIRHYISPSHAL